jgi:hypothetical protein
MAKNISYFDNLKKELSDRSKASDKFSKAKYEATYGVMGIKQPGSQARASKTRANVTKATGQLFGALLMGARYDDKTGKRIDASKPKPMTGIAKPVKKAAAKKK